jgi:hypothetical protein
LVQHVQEDHPGHLQLQALHQAFQLLRCPHFHLKNRSQIIIKLLS